MASISIQISEKITQQFTDLSNVLSTIVHSFEVMRTTSMQSFNLKSLQAVREELDQMNAKILEVNNNVKSMNATPMVQSFSVPGKNNNAKVDANNSIADSVANNWITEKNEVFTGTELVRFKQEIVSANEMLNKLHHTQAQIAIKANTTDLFPTNMVEDINNMHSRIVNVRESMKKFENNKIVIGTDKANDELEKLRSILNSALKQQETLNHAVKNMDVSAANAAYNQLCLAVSGVERKVRENTSVQEKFNTAISEGTAKSASLFSKIKDSVSSFVNMPSLTSVMKTADHMSLNNTRLSALTGSKENAEEVQDKIYQSAQNSKSSYSAMTDSVVQFGTKAGNNFSNTGEIVSFNETLNKMFASAGKSQDEVTASTQTMIQAFSAGVISGEDFNEVFAGTPSGLQAIADYMNVPVDSLSNMASQGQITADIIKNALLASSGSINDEFQNVPTTFEQLGIMIQDKLINAFQPALAKIAELTSNETFMNVFNGIINCISNLGTVASIVIGFLTGSAEFIANNWSLISPIIYGLAAALALYGGYLLISNGLEAISKGLKIASIAASYAKAVATGTEVSATTSAAAAQRGLNTSLLSCPLTWIILLIIALIAVFYFVIGVINEFAGTSISATGLIVGAFATVGAFIMNIFIGVINFIIGIGIELYNLIASFANAFGTIFNHPVEGIIMMFSGLFDFILGIVQRAAKLIDTVIGSNLSGSIKDFRNSFNNAVDEIIGQNKVEVMTKLDASDYEIDRINYEDAANAGYNLGKDLENKLNPSNLFDSKSNPLEEYEDKYGDFLNNSINENNGSNVSENIGNIANDTSNMSQNMEVSNEDLKYLIDIAERDVINRFTTAEVKVALGGITQNVNSNQDLDGIISYITKNVEEQLQITAEAYSF